MVDLSRRSFLRVVGQAAAGLTGLGRIRRVAASEFPHWRAQPEHVTLYYDRATLREYQPRYQIQPADQEKLISQFAWTATSPEYQTDCHVYWTEYTHQDGFSVYDSHNGDHEPVYVFADSETGSIETVVASVYHWLRGTADATTIPTTDTRPHLRVMNPHHHHTAPTPDTGLYDPPLRSLLAPANGHDTRFTDWLAGPTDVQGMAHDLYPGATTNPWVMLGRDHWWRDIAAGLSIDALIVKTWAALPGEDVGVLTSEVAQ
jgi:hypothetical protein